MGVLGRSLPLAFVAGLLVVGGCLLEPTTALSPEARRGSTLYDRYCSLCHGEQGQGYLADDANALNNQAFLSSVSELFLVRAITEGRPGTSMSAWGAAYGGPLTDSDVGDLVAYLRSWQTEPDQVLDTENRSLGSADRAQAIFPFRCAGCHGDQGQGASGVSLNNPVFLDSVSDGFLRHTIIHGRPGTPMPGFGGQLTGQAVDDLVILMRSWQLPVGDRRPAVQELPPLDDAILNPEGPDPDWEATERYISADRLLGAIEGSARLVVVDARPSSDYFEAHIPGAVSLPFYDAESKASELSSGAWTVSYCACPHAEADVVADALIAQGHTQVRVLDEGFRDWRARDFPVEPEPEPEPESEAEPGFFPTEGLELP